MTPAEAIAREQAKAKRQGHELAMLQQFRAVGLTPLREFEWHPTRKWRSDFAFVEDRLLVECDGGLYTNGGHTRGAAREKDMERDAAALIHGWRVLRLGPNHIKSGDGLRWIQSLLMVEVTA